MGEMQLWQSDGLGTDKDTLKKVLNIFKKDGVQGMESQQALNRYIQQLDDSGLWQMYRIDKEAALQIFADCFGVVFTAEKYSEWQNDTFKKAIDILIKEKETAKQETEANRAELLKVRQKLNEEIDSLRNECSIRNCEKEEAEQQIKELQNSLAHYKADLYDFYAQAGKIPNYERR